MPQPDEREKPDVPAPRAPRRPNSQSKLTFEQAEQVRQRYATGEQVVDLAREHGVTRATIYMVLGDRSYKAERALPALRRSVSEAERAEVLRLYNERCSKLEISRQTGLHPTLITRTLEQERLRRDMERELQSRQAAEQPALPTSPPGPWRQVSACPQCGGPIYDRPASDPPVVHFSCQCRIFPWPSAGAQTTRPSPPAPSPMPTPYFSPEDTTTTWPPPSNATICKTP